MKLLECQRARNGVKEPIYIAPKKIDPLQKRVADAVKTGWSALVKKKGPNHTVHALYQRSLGTYVTVV